MRFKNYSENNLLRSQVETQILNLPPMMDADEKKSLIDAYISDLVERDHEKPAMAALGVKEYQLVDVQGLSTTQRGSSSSTQLNETANVNPNAFKHALADASGTEVKLEHEAHTKMMTGPYKVMLSAKAALETRLRDAAMLLAKSKIKAFDTTTIELTIKVLQEHVEKVVNTIAIAECIDVGDTSAIQGHIDEMDALKESADNVNDAAKKSIKKYKDKFTE